MYKCLSAQAFSGLISSKKENLFIDDCMLITLHYHMSYWDAYMLPVAVRRYMIKSFMQMKAVQNQPTKPSLPPMKTARDVLPSAFQPQ